MPCYCRRLAFHASDSCRQNGAFHLLIFRGRGYSLEYTLYCDESVGKDRKYNVMRLFFSFVAERKVKVRIMFRKTENQYSLISNADKYFKLYYQFIKHAFGFAYTQGMPPFSVRIYLDQLPAKRDHSLPCGCRHDGSSKNQGNSKFKVSSF